MGSPVPAPATGVSVDARRGACYQGVLPSYTLERIMLMGNNVDISRRGKTVHIQTEDLGRGVMKIMTQVFVSGAILDTRTVSYAGEIAKYEAEERQNEVIRKMMLALGRHFMKQIHAGMYDEKLGLPPMSELEIAEAQRPPALTDAELMAKNAPPEPDLTRSVPPMPATGHDISLPGNSSGNLSITGMGLAIGAHSDSGAFGGRSSAMSDAWVAIAVSSMSASPSRAFRGLADLEQMERITSIDIRDLFTRG